MEALTPSRLRTTPRRGLLGLWLLASAAWGACGAITTSGAQATVTGPTGGVPEVFPPIPRSDSGGPPQEDAAAAATGDVGPETIPKAGKADGPTFPPQAAGRSEVTLSGTHAAWVERDLDGTHPRLVVWPLAPGTAPQPFALPTLPVEDLEAPRELSLGARHLFYVDDRYGDPDLFAIRLSDGKSITVAALPGAQEHPRALGEEVVWQDCRACALDGDPGGREIYRRDMGVAEAVRLSDDALEDRAPCLGTLTNGASAAAWLREDTTIRLVGVGVDKTFLAAAASRIGQVVLTGGVIAHRPEPVIINPDSMMPTPVTLLLSVTGLPLPSPEASLATVMGETPAALAAAGGRIAWLSHDRTDESQRVEIVEVGAGQAPAPIDPIETEGASGLAMGGDWVGFTAPHPDTGGLDNVWLFALGEEP